MKAIGLYKYLPIEDKKSLQDIDVPKPEASGYDLLDAVKAISVNPVDTKIRAPKDQIESVPRILGWDAAGEVIAIGLDVQHYKVGDEVYYAGDITRQRVVQGKLALQYINISLYSCIGTPFFFRNLLW